MWDSQESYKLCRCLDADNLEYQTWTNYLNNFVGLSIAIGTVGWQLCSTALWRSLIPSH
jgi:hypothetical protein